METRQRGDSQVLSHGAGEGGGWLGLGQKWGRQEGAISVRRFVKNHNKLQFLLSGNLHTRKSKNKKEDKPCYNIMGNVQ